MLRSRRNDAARPNRLGRQNKSHRSGFTLVEMLIASSILGFSAAVMSGVMLAISSAWDYSTALEDTRRQAQSSLSRVKWMVQQAGTYQVSGQSATLGLAVVSSSWSTYQVPSTLVVWSGGSNGGMTSQGLQSRLPLASELVIYTPDPATASNFVEVTFPGNNTSIDFRAGTFASTIQSLMTLTSRQTVKLSDRLHTVSGNGSATSVVGCNRFELTFSPTDAQISSVVVGSQNWNSLNWGQGLVGASQGLRTANLRIELLLDPDPTHPAMNTDGYSTALPFFESVNRHYVFHP